MKHLSIKWRVLALALLPAAIIATLLAIHFIDSRIGDLQKELRDRGLVIARQLAPAAEYGVFVRNPEILRTLTDSVEREADVVLVTLIDASGQLLALSGDATLRRPRTALPEVSGGVGIVELADSLVFTTPIYQTQTAVEDVPEAGNAAKNSQITIIGWATVTMSKASTLARRNQLVRDSLLISALVLGGAALLALRMSVGITRPMRKLVEAVRRIGQGDLDVNVQVGSGGEIAALADGINSMAGSLKAAQENLQEKIDFATKQLSYQASHDMLTGLVNRREFEVRLEQAVGSARDNGAVHALCFLDLDQFKVVNDSSGHEAGDQLLRQLAQHLKQKIRDRDTLARLGGDEFALLLENCSADHAMEVARGLVEGIQNFRFSWQGKTFVVGGSIGLVTINRKSENAAAVLSHADAACYTAKDLGRNRVYLYRSPEDGDVTRPAGTSWVTRINQALEEQRFRLYYQPILPIGPGHAERPRYYEALLRMVQDDGEIVLPLAFIPAAERFNLMQAIDRWVVGAVFADYQRLAAAGFAVEDCVLSMNLSGASLCDEQFAKFLEYQFATWQVPPHRVCFEITETAVVTNLTQALSLMQQFRRIGCRFMLDDFGSGLSSFTYLKNLPVDGIKIDGAFVKDMVTNSIDAAMVEAINNIGHVMGLVTVAEYVEDQAVMNMVEAQGIDYVQGNWPQPPLPMEECFELNIDDQYRAHG